MGLLVAVLTTCVAAQARPRSGEFKAMTWNIWRGGREDGMMAGPRRVVEVIQRSGVDIVAMQETYGSGELIAKELGFHFLPRGTNLSIHSRFPIVEDISVHEPFKCLGALIELPNKSRVAFYSIWLPYSGEIWEAGTRNVNDLASMLAACAASKPDLEMIRDGIAERLRDPKYKDVPVIIAGDYNSMSHLDYAAVARDQYQAVVDWPTSHVLMDAGYRDAYRELNPVIDRARDRTWTPRFPKQEQDRIDFIYYRGRGLEATESAMIDHHPTLFPSDHAAVVAKFRFDPQAKPVTEVKSRVVSYNIRHGRGMDDKLDLARTAATLRRLNPDIVGLQEVDLRVRRSGSVNQAAELGKRLKMHAAFGAFMDHDGGWYGMGILSRYPLRNVQSVVLPVGNEPRVALAAEVRLPSDESLMVVNVHFDWVEDDDFRFAQASALAEYLLGLKMPYVLLGDFNDEPGSRTISLFRSLAGEAKKPASDHFTYSAAQPEKEIDFVFFWPPTRWVARRTRIVDEKLASDHRPVFTELTLRPDR
jgi:endonuclease/exonuclease/phosphatase family metal-dependent hydrolase